MVMIEKSKDSMKRNPVSSRDAVFQEEVTRFPLTVEPNLAGASK